jgi:tRNA dimethylallyltransferase
VAAELAAVRLVAIVGPTASGKSALAMETALRLGGEIVSCDSVQVYRGLDIGSGKPSRAERDGVPHHLVDILDPWEEMNAGLFAERAALAISDIYNRGRLPIVSGGTGLYLTALLKGLFEHGGANAALRGRLDRLAERFGAARLHRLLSVKDPAYAAKTKPADRIRIVRALEVCLTLRKPFSQAQAERRPAFQGKSLLIGLHPAREELRERVVARTAQMLAKGLVAETRNVLDACASASQRPRALGAIGYREVVARLAQGPLNPLGDDELQRAIVTATMQYAKRQMTYFKNQFQVAWFPDARAAARHIEEWVEREEGPQETGPRGIPGPAAG